jgi:hypothetical protein
VQRNKREGRGRRESHTCDVDDFQPGDSFHSLLPLSKMSSIEEEKAKKRGEIRRGRRRARGRRETGRRETY